MNNPNAWAVVSLWRVFFQYKEEEQERQRVEAQESLCSLFDITVETIRPVASDTARRERLEFARQGYRDAMNAPPRTRQRIMQEREVAPQVMSPNLDIPRGNEYLYLPQ